MGGASTTVRDVWAVQNNIAGISKIKNTEAAVYYQNRFGMADLNYVSLATVKPIKSGAIGVSLDRFGNSNLNEQRLGLGYALNVDKISFGGKVNLLQLSLKDLGTKTVAAIEFGAIARLTNELVFAANIYNFNKARMADYNDERFSTVMKAGLSYQPFKKLFVNLETEKNNEYNADVKFGVDYMISDKVWVRSGFSTLSRIANFGAGFQTSSFNIDYAISSHTVLGISNHLSISYSFAKKEKATPEPIEETITE